MRRESKQKRVRERGANRSLTSSYLEADHDGGSDDEGAISLAAIKSKHKKGAGKGGNIYLRLLLLN